MRYGLIFCLGLILAAPASAQDQPAGDNLYAAPDARQVLVQTGVVFQRYSIEFESGATREIGQTAIPLFVAVPVNDAFSVSLRTAYASAGGDDFETLAGIADAQLGLSYRHAVGPAEVVASLGVGLPLGSAGLTGEELGTALVLARGEFAFEAPALRQGLRFSPGVTVAVPLDRNVIAGFGASYQVRQAFTPFEAIDLSYTPGNEFLLTGGLDFGMGRSSILSLDLSYAMYGSDAFGENTFEPGDRFSATINFVGGIGQQAIGFLARYSHRGDATVGEVPFSAPVTDAATLIVRGQFAFPGDVGLGLSLGTRYLGDFREIRDATHDVENVLALARHQLLFEGGLAPSVRVTPEVTLLSSFTYTLGLGKLVDLADVTPMSGFRGQLGVSVRI